MFGEILEFIGLDNAEDAAAQRNQANLNAAHDQQTRNIEMQREFAKHGIRWRVEDAQAAGLHPLYAIGGSGASFSPNPVVVGGSGGNEGAAKVSAMRSLGQGLDRAVFGTMTPEQRQIHHAQLKVLEAQAAKDFALAAAAQSQQSLARQSEYVSAPIPLGAPAWDPGGEHSGIGSGYLVQGRELTHDAYKIKETEAPSVQSGFPNVQAGPQGGTPGLMEVRLGQGFSMLLPRSQDLGESLEALVNPLTWGPIYQANVEKYGPGWEREFWRQMPGVGRAIGLGESLGAALADAADRWRAYNQGRSGASDPRFRVGRIRRPNEEWPHATDVYSKYR